MRPVQYLVLNSKTGECYRFCDEREVAVFMWGEDTKDYIIAKVIHDTPSEFEDMKERLSSFGKPRQIEE